MSTSNGIAAFAVVLTQNAPKEKSGPTAIAADAVSLWQLAARLQHLAEQECNREITDSEKRRIERGEKAVRELLLPYGGEARFDGDPRGCVVKVRFPGGQRNDWGGEDLWCVGA